MEVPECPVCLEYYDDETTIPRVLSCGHTVCEACLVELPQRYPNTIRCPACTQLVKYSPNQGPSSLPKNIDLLRICLQQHSSSSSSNHSRKSNQQSSINHEASSRFWPDEVYSAWKDWILPHDAVLVDDQGVFRVGSGSVSSSKGRGCFGVNRTVSLAPIVSLPAVGDSKFKFSYVARIIKCLEGMDEVVREGLSLILEASVRQSRICRVYGLWSEVGDGPLYLVCERQSGRVLDKLGELRNGFAGVNEDGLQLDKGGILGFAMIAKGICEAVLALHLEGLVAGCLGVSCFSFDELGGICIDLNEVLVMGRKIRDGVSGGVGGKPEEENEVFISPEVLSTILHKGTINSGSVHSRYPIGYGSDVWSLACVLLRLLVGDALPRSILEMCEEDDIGISGSSISWVENVSSVLEEKIGSEYLSLKQTFCKCLDMSSGSRPDVVDVRKTIQDLLVKHQVGFLGDSEVTKNRNNAGHPLILAKLSQLPAESSKEPREHELPVKEDSEQPNILHEWGDNSDDDFVAGLSKGMTELKDLQGHLDCITALAVGAHFNATYKPDS